MNDHSTAGMGNLARQIYLVWKAMGDPSVPWAAKWLIPLAAFAYVISPVDLIPLFPLDDLVVVFVAINLFMRMLAKTQTDQSGQAAPGNAGPSTDGQYHHYRSGFQRQPSASAPGTGQTIETTWRVIEK